VFAAVRERDAESGEEVVVLRDPAGALEARVAPLAGANLYSLRADGEELLEQPPSLAALAVSPAGTPILFPSPNRVRDATFVFEGRRFSFQPNQGPNFIHGLVRRRPWQSGCPVGGARRAAVCTWIDWDERQPEFASFPVTHRLTVRYTLGRGRLGIGYRVANRGPGPLPFGFAIHPWFRVPGARADVLVRIPAAERMEAEDKLPTGRLLPVEGTPYDLRRATSLEALDLDEVYLEQRPGAPVSIEWRDRRLRLTLAGTAAFTHLVVYTPPGRPFFCIENQTCSTDAHNLHARGFAREAHLQVVPPGGSAHGFVLWRVRRLPA
jgi:aldose 1-epimerase